MERWVVSIRTIELFSGTGSFSKVAKAHGHEIFTVDFDKRMNPDLVSNILNVEILDLPKNPDVVWASPPCTHFSVASIGRNWEIINQVRMPKTKGAEEAIQIVKKTLKLIEELNPRFWFIENPRGMLRSMPMMEAFTRRTVTYCQYGDKRMKPTDIWTNCLSWTPKPHCKNGDLCHEKAPRGSRCGTQAIKGAKDRAVIPPLLMEEIISACERGLLSERMDKPVYRQGRVEEY